MLAEAPVVDQADFAPAPIQETQKAYANFFPYLLDSTLYAPAFLSEAFDKRGLLNSHSAEQRERSKMEFFLFLLDLAESKNFPAKGDAPGAVLDDTRAPAWFGGRWKNAYASWLRRKKAQA